MKSVDPESVGSSDSAPVNVVLTSLRLFSAAVFLVAFTITAQAADFTGKWIGTSHTSATYCNPPQPGSDGDASIKIVQTGDTFSGAFTWTFENSDNCNPETEPFTATVGVAGTVDGDTFTADVTFFDEEIGPVTSIDTMTGSVSGDVISLTWIEPSKPGDTGYPEASNLIVVAQLTLVPLIPPSAAINSLWPPNSKMVDIGLALGSDDSATFLVYSDEAAGRTADASGSLFLRAERNGTGDGRVYLIAITSADDDGNITHTCLTAVVPKSQSASDIASVNNQAAAALTQCPVAPTGYFVIKR